MFAKIIITFLTLAFSLAQLNAQDILSQKLLLAESYRQQLDYKRAVILYKEILDERFVQDAYDGLADIYYDQKMYSELLPLVERAMDESKPNSSRVGLLSLLAELKWRKGNTTTADSLWSEAIKLYPLVPETYNEVAISQQKVSELDRALDTYTKGNEMIEGRLFSANIIKLLVAKGDYKTAVPLILDDLKQNKNLNTAIGRLYPFLSSSSEASKYIGRELARYDSRGQNLLFSELYLWYLTSIDDMDEALLVVNKLDYLKKSDGREINSFASQMVQEGKYDIAIKAYEELMDKGETHRYYNAALYGYANTTQKKMESGNNFTAERAEEILDFYLDIIDKGNRDNITAIAMLRAAMLYREPLGNQSEAIALLEQLNALIPPTYENFQGQVILAEIYTASGEFAKARAIYENIPLTFKKTVKIDEINNILFNVAVLNLFEGKIEQVAPILKKAISNSSLNVANDAIELNQLLSSTKDTTRLIEFGKGLYEEFRGNILSAIEIHKSLLGVGDALDDQIAYRIADLSYRDNNYSQAIYYVEVIKSKDILSPLAERASLLKAKSEFAMGENEKSLSTYKRFMMDYPNSIHIDDVRKTAREIRSNLK